MQTQTGHQPASHNAAISPEIKNGIRTTLSRIGRSCISTVPSASTVAIRHESPTSSNRITEDIGMMGHTVQDTMALHPDAQRNLQHDMSHVLHMVHEIRNPLNGIIPLIEMLRSGEYESDRMKFLEYMDISARMIQTLVNNVLDVARLEAGKMELHQASFDPVQLVSEVIKSQMGALVAKDIMLTTDIAPTVPRWLEGDAFHLKQILMNLLGNAVKFTDKGTIIIAITVDGSSADQIMLGIRVKDSGVGISPEEMQHLFEPFHQASISSSVHRGGSGLGLSISLKLAKLMGGRLWAESAPGQGSTFHLHVPLTRIFLAAEQTPCASSRSFSGSAMTDTPPKQPLDPENHEHALF